MGPKSKRSLSPKSAAAQLAEAKRQAVEEQRQRAEEYAQKFLKSPNDNKKGAIIPTDYTVYGNAKDAEVKNVAETPSKTRKRLSSAVPTPEIYKNDKKSKLDSNNDNPFSIASGDLENKNESTTLQNRRRKSLKPTVEAIMESLHEDSPKPSKESDAQLLPSTTPRKRRNFDIPEESLNAALNPPKLASAAKKRTTHTAHDVHPTREDDESHEPVVPIRNRRKTLSSLPRDDDVSESSAEVKLNREPRRSSFSTLTNRLAKKENTASAIPEEQEEIIQKPTRFSTLSNIKEEATSPLKSPVMNTFRSPVKAPLVETTAVPSPKNIPVTTVSEKEIAPVVTPEVTKEEPEPSVWDSVVPYLWIIIYIQLLVILAVVLYYADTRLIGVSAIIVSIIRRFFHYFV